VGRRTIRSQHFIRLVKANEGLQLLISAPGGNHLNFYSQDFNPETSASYELIYLCKDPFAGESGVLLWRPEG